MACLVKQVMLSFCKTRFTAARSFIACIPVFIWYLRRLVEFYQALVYNSLV